MSPLNENDRVVLVNRLPTSLRAARVAHCGVEAAWWSNAAMRRDIPGRRKLSPVARVGALRRNGGQ
jgi:hypothetical protein